MSKLFETTKIKSLTLPNRFVRSATWTAMASPTDGSPSPLLIDKMVKLAQGGVGLIIPGMALIEKEDSSGTRQLGVYSDDLIPGLSSMTKAVHKAGGKIAMQIVHPGLQAPLMGWPLGAIGPSVMQGEKGPLNREMTLDDIRGVVNAFGQAAVRAQKAGFDGVEIHGAHGWLLSEFLSPFFNKRTDAYGGSIENRARIVLETIRSIRKAVSNQYPVMIKVNSEDLLPGGLSVDDMLRAAVMFEDAGIDAIELSGGTTWGGFVLGNWDLTYMKTVKTEAYWREAAMRLKKTVNVPVMLVGGIRSFETAEQLVNGGVADYVSLSRPLMREPNLVNRWKSGDTSRAACISENACGTPERLAEALAGKGVRCVHVKE
jgi:2,4-dienoyl-CoA reductase-like NADH-dependent reductase (Old Yellow Enzyme family)